jgi:cytochrome bd-type quinol oxidase subunit 1
MKGENRQGSGKSTLTLVATLAMIAGVGLVLFFGTAPLETLLGESTFAFVSAVHGLLAGLLMVTVTIGVFQAYRLWAGSSITLQELEIGSLANAVLAFLTIYFGNVIYIPYRATGGPRTYFLENMPEVHEIFFEFKEFMALFVLPLTVCVAFMFFYYREDLLRRRELRILVSICLLLVFFYFILTFGLGAAITKLRAV